MAQAGGDAFTIGTPQTGGPGVTETVATIMSRPVPPPSAQALRKLKPRFTRGAAGLPQNPNAPVSSQWPPAPHGPFAPVTNSFAGGPFTLQLTGTSFLGAQLSETPGFVPPDSMADVGTNQILVCVNGLIKTYTKSGVPDGALDTSTDTFFASVLGGSSTSDPRVRFDRLSGRWFITMITVNTPNFVLLAVSSGPTITSKSSFTFYTFQADPSNFGDYDTLGVDANALYIGLNIFSGNNFVTTTGFVVNKANLLSGTLTVTTFANLVVSSGHPHQMHGPFTPQGVNNDDPAATMGYFIGVDAGTFGTLVVRQISNPGGTPSISGNILVTVPATGNALGGVPVLGSTANLADLDDRLFATRMHNGALWTAHNIEVDTNGAASSAGGRDGSRWYELTNMSTSPTVVQSGTLFDPSASNPRNFWIPSCAMSGQGHMALGSSVANANEFADIAAAGRFATDPAGSLQSPTTAFASTNTYNIGIQNGTYRWGDFSVTTVDPSDDMTMWTVQEYCNTNNSWGVRVIKLIAPPPATPVSCLPSTVTQGVANASLTLAGSSSSGSGFFDPGTGFPNHISATVNGGGVTVSSITYNNPTNITLNVTVAGNAAIGSRTVTVINPDGQSATSASGILTVVSPGAGNQPPVLAPVANQSVAAGATLIVTNSAGDPDGDQLTFSLGAGAAAGASINPTNGIFSWTPTQSQAGTNSFNVIVTDSGLPPLSATQTFLVTVTATNVPPSLAAIPNRSVSAGTTLLVTNSASDSDGDRLTFNLGVGAATGAAINPTNGVFSWTPTQSQAGTNAFSVIVTDSGSPPLSATQSFFVTVIATNMPPSLAAISNQTVTAGMTLLVTNSASDPDGDVLTFSLDLGAPPEATIGTTNGVLSWTPSDSEVGTSNITVRVTDNGAPPLSATQTFSVTVVSRPIAAIAVSNNFAIVSWNAYTGGTYEVQFRTNVDDTNWNILPPDVVSPGATASTTDAVDTNNSRFYRIRVVP